MWKKKDISWVFIDYFKNIYTSQGPNKVHKCLANVDAQVTNDMNYMLLKPFLEQEV